jgi:hypothetical protein
MFMGAGTLTSLNSRKWNMVRSLRKIEYVNED